MFLTLTFDFWVMVVKHYRPHGNIWQILDSNISFIHQNDSQQAVHAIFPLYLYTISCMHAGWVLIQHICQHTLWIIDICWSAHMHVNLHKFRQAVCPVSAHLMYAVERDSPYWTFTSTDLNFYFACRHWYSWSQCPAIKIWQIWLRYLCTKVV